MKVKRITITIDMDEVSSEKEIPNILRRMANSFEEKEPLVMPRNDKGKSCGFLSYD